MPTIILEAQTASFVGIIQRRGHSLIGEAVKLYLPATMWGILIHIGLKQHMQIGLNLFYPLRAGYGVVEVLAGTL